MKEILILTGACGVGKTSIATEWAQKKSGAIIECDFLTEWIYDKNFPHFTLQEEIFVANLASKMASDYLSLGMSTAIENVWTPAGIELIQAAFESKTDIKIKAVWLYCERSENHRRDALRVPENQMKLRVDIVNEELEGQIWPKCVHKIDSTDLSIDQTIALIENLSYDDNKTNLIS